MRESLGLSDLRPIHLPATANKEADFLSRPDCWAITPLPEALEGIQIETPAEQTTDWYRPTPPGRDEADWQGSEALLAAWANRLHGSHTGPLKRMQKDREGRCWSVGVVKPKVRVSKKKEI